MVNHRDEYGIEVDAIVQLCGWRLGATENRLGEGQPEDTDTNLKHFTEQIDSQLSGSPTFSP